MLDVRELIRSLLQPLNGTLEVIDQALVGDPAPLVIH
jgi:hypothetical protein